MLYGCAGGRYYLQAIAGHSELLVRSQPVTRLLAREQLPDRLRQPLQQSQQLLRFAREVLALEVGNSYRRYTDLGRAYVLWNVFAAPELSLEPRQWCYPLIGCACYRGFFDRSQAQRLGQQLQQAGYDVYIGGVKAYSTLGWFNDPLLNTFIHDGEVALARLLFHELAHKKLYIPGDTAFNESFATVVELEGTRQWLDSLGRTDVRVESPLVAGVLERVMATRTRLQQLYRQPIADHLKRQGKQQILDRLQADCQRLCAMLADSESLDDWLSQPFNNARLNSLISYRSWVLGLTRLLRRSAGWADFYAQAARLGTMPAAARAQALARLQGDELFSGEAVKQPRD